MGETRPRSRVGSSASVSADSIWQPSSFDPSHSLSGDSEEQDIYKKRSRVSSAWGETYPNDFPPNDSHNSTLTAREASYLAKIAALESKVAVLERENTSLKNQISGQSPPDTVSSSSNSISNSKRKSSYPSEMEERSASVDNTVIDEISSKMETHWRFNGVAGQDDIRGGADVMSGKASLSPLTLFASPFSPIGKAQRTSLYKSMITYLPPRLQVDQLIEFYFAEFDLPDQCLHRPTFIKSLNEFWSTDPSLRGSDSSDLTFLAMIFSILLGTACLLPKERWITIGVQNESLEQFDEILEKWNLAYLTLLAASDWLQTPTIYAIQSVIMARRYYWRKSRFGSSVVMNTTALRAAEFLGFGLLGTAEQDEVRWSSETSPPTKPEFGYRSHVLRETARRTWRTLLALENVSHSHACVSRFVSPQVKASTGPPLSIEDELLQDGAPIPYDSISIGKGALMEAWKSLSSLTPVWEAAQAGSYEEILRVDDQTRAFMSSLPIFLKQDGYTEFLPQVISEVEAKPYLLSARLNINCALHTNLLQLHKPYQAASYSDPTYSRSLEACIFSASWILRTLNASVLSSKIDGPASASTHLFFQRYYTPLYLYPAASVLLVHLTQERITGQEAKEVLDDIDRAIDFTQRIADEHKFQIFARQAAILRSFRSAVLHRRFVNSKTVSEASIFKPPVRPVPSRLSYPDLAATAQMNRSRSLSNQTPESNFRLPAQPMPPARSSGANLRFSQRGDEFNLNSTPHIHLPPEPLGNERNDFMGNLSSNRSTNQANNELSQAEDRKIQLELDDFVKSLLQEDNNHSETGGGDESQSQNSTQRNSFFPVLDQFLVPTTGDRGREAVDEGQ